MKINPELVVILPSEQSITTRTRLKCHVSIFLSSIGSTMGPIENHPTHFSLQHREPCMHKCFRLYTCVAHAKTPAFLLVN